MQFPIYVYIFLNRTHEDWMPVKVPRESILRWLLLKYKQYFRSAQPLGKTPGASH